MMFAIVPAALASATWNVEGVHGSNKNDCRSSRSACKTISHAITLASPGDSLIVAPATHLENLDIPFSLKIVGYTAEATIIAGGGVASPILNTHNNTHLTLSHLTLRDNRGDQLTPLTELTIAPSESDHGS
jgi:hypothetical protein